MVDVDAILRPYYDRIVEAAGELELFDAHTHVGANDPDGYRQAPAQLVGVEEVRGPGAEALVRELDHALDLVALRLDADAFAAIVHARSIGHRRKPL